MFFNQLDPNIIAALIVGFVSMLGYFITRYFEKKKLIEQQIREQKLPTYEEFLEFLFDIFIQHKKSKPVNVHKLEDSFWKMNRKSILWLSDKTLKSYINWKELLTESTENRTDTDNFNILFSLERLLMDFRKDIGHKNRGIKKGQILSLFIKDLKQYQLKRSFN